MIVSCGEALIDMLPRRSEDGRTMYEPVVGGAVFNTAKALGRLGVASGYFGCLSRDAFGELLIDALEAASVQHDLCPRSDLPTALAMVSLQQGTAEYSFHFAETAGLSLSAEALPTLPDTVLGMHFGGISLVAEPCGSAYEALCLREAPRRLVSIDPNIRPDFVADEAAYRARLARMLAVAQLVKVSDVDLDWLAPDESYADYAQRLVQGAAELVVVTRGEQPALVFTPQHTLEVAPVLTTVVDTVGAGDTFVAGLWAGLSMAGLCQLGAVGSAASADIQTAVAYAQKAASISVSRAGADSPWLNEMS